MKTLTANLALTLTLSLMTSATTLALQPSPPPAGDNGGDRAQPGGGGRGGDGQQQGERRGRRGGGGGGGGGWGGGWGGMGMQQVFEPSVNSDDIKSWKDRLKLSDEQNVTVEALFEAYQTQFAADAKVARDQVEALREEARQAQDPSIFQDIMAERQAFAKKRTAMEKSFFADVQAVLNEQQMSEWPRIERDRRREQTLGRGLIAGERVDVVRLVEDMDLSPEQMTSVQPILDQYKDDLDRELITRNELLEEGQSRMREFMQAAMGGGEENPDLEKLVTRGRDAGMRVRDVNRKYARQIEGVLPEEKKAAFAAEVKRESFPMIYRPMYGTRVLDAADKMEGLTDTQKTSLASIRDTYTRDMSALQSQMEKAMEDEQANFSLATMRQRGFGGMMNGPMADLDKQRRELDTTTFEKVKGVLTPEQAEKLPERRGGAREGDDGEQGERPRRRMRGGGAGGEGGGGRGGDNPPADRPA